MVHVCIILLQKSHFKKGMLRFDCIVLFRHRSVVSYLACE